MDNEQGYAEAYREVIHEDSLRVEKTVKAPDYCFRVGGQRKFFVEAKKPDWPRCFMDCQAIDEHYNIHPYTLSKKSAALERRRRFLNHRTDPRFRVTAATSYEN